MSATSNPDIVACRVHGKTLVFVDTRQRVSAAPPEAFIREKFIAFPHQGKERLYVEALEAANFRRTNAALNAKFALTDLDVGARLKKLHSFQTRDLPVFVYPHAAQPAIWSDGWYPSWP